MKNKAGELLKTKDEPKKQTGNKAKTKLAILLKTIETPKKQSENKPKNKAGHVVENKALPKNKPETKRKSHSNPKRHIAGLHLIRTLASLPFSNLLL
ncbi:MAG: hypothetical protein P8Z30_11585 [Acidobacteriota bacterium]